MNDVRVMYLSYLETPEIQESICDSVTAVYDMHSYLHKFDHVQLINLLFILMYTFYVFRSLSFYLLFFFFIFTSVCQHKTRLYIHLLVLIILSSPEPKAQKVSS